MDYVVCLMIYQDMQEYIPDQHLPQISKIYEHLCGIHCSEAAALVALLHGVTAFFPDIHKHMCTQRGLNHLTSFSTEGQLICYTSAEFARERYNVSDEVYYEILHFEDVSYISETKTEVKRIMAAI